MEAIRPRRALTPGQVVFLDLVRGVGAGLVLLNHIQLLLGLPTNVFGIAPGPLGVTLFFLVSGFLIDRSARGHKGDYGLREFLIDRVARIYVCFAPALMFTAAVVSVLVKQPRFVGEAHFGLWQLIGNLLMLQGYPAFQVARRAGFDTPWFVHPYALAEPYWTIPIELYLYIAFGLFQFVVVKRSEKWSGWLLPLAAISTLPVLYHAATGWGESLSIVWVLGALGSRIFHSQPAPGEEPPGTQPNPLRRTGGLLTIMAAAAFLLALRLLSRGGDFYDLQKALFLGVLLLCGLELSSGAAWLSAAAVRVPAELFAKTSYALYLTHNVLIGWAVMRLGKDLSAVQIAGLVAACQGCAWVFWWMFDRHHKRVADWLKESHVARPATARVPQS
jgi:peptidoglycan/LPS O-acetylase OafA/YrhL